MRLIILVLSLVAVTASAGPAGPGTAAVKQANDTISGLLKSKAPAAQVTTAVRNFLDVDELGKAAMVNQWSKLKPAEQAEFLKVLHELIEANYAKGMNANLDYKVTYDGESTDKDGHVVVQTTIEAQRKNRPVKIKVDYVLVKTGATLKAYDVITEGADLVEGYRTSFDKIVKDKGFPALVATMKKKAAELQSTAPTAPAPTPTKAATK